MAGQSLRATAPLSPSSFLASPDAPRRVLAASRTRRNHGVFLIGDELATVYSSRRSADSFGVSMTVGNGALVLTGSMTPAQARAMAAALNAAACAADAGCNAANSTGSAA